MGPSLQSVLESKEKLYEELEEARGKTKGLTLDQNGTNIVNIELAVERLEMERYRLTYAKIK